MSQRPQRPKFHEAEQFALRMDHGLALIGERGTDWQRVERERREAEEAEEAKRQALANHPTLF